VNDRLLTADELAERLNVPTSWVREQARQGGIPVVRLGRYVPFYLPAVAAELEKNGAPGIASGAGVARTS
jgi:excisionase family DNA binding protein